MNIFGMGHRSLPRLPLVAAVLLPLAGCDLDSVLEVTDPDVVTPEIARDPSNLPGVRNGAFGDFAVAFSGQGNNVANLVAFTGLMADEFYLSDTFGTRREVDKREVSIQNSEMTTLFRDLHRARRAAEVATELFAQNSANSVGHAEVANLAAYTYLFFGENYCSGVPFSRLREDNTLEHGQPQSTQQIYATALQRFDEALQVATAARSTAQQNVARVGRARTLLDQGRFAEAAAAAREVPTSFVFNVEHSENTPRQQNGIFFLAHQRRGFGVASREGRNGIDFRVGNSQDRNSQDPRVPYTRTNTRAIDAPFAHFFELRYPARASNVPLASGVEARLIEAEAALRAGGDHLSILNNLRANAPALLAGFGLSGAALPALTDPGTPQGRVDQLFRERAFWLYLTAHRLSDLRRLVRQYGRPAESVFPSGEYARPVFARTNVADQNLATRVQGTYGRDVDFPIPFDEQNNPNFRECTSRGA